MPMFPSSVAKQYNYEFGLRTSAVAFYSIRTSPCAIVFIFGC